MVGDVAAAANRASGDPAQSWDLRARQFVPAVIPGGFFAVAATVAAFHPVFREFDGLMQLASGQTLVREGIYEGWASHFWPPLYAALAGVLDLVVGGIWATKLVSLFAATATLGVVYAFTHQVTGSRRAGVVAQALVAVNPLFFQNAFQAQNHMLDTFLFVAAVWLLVRAIRAPSAASMTVAGLAAGLAVMARYQSAVIVVPAGVTLLIVAVRSRRGVWYGLAYVAGMTIVCLPWVLQNWQRNGSPIATWQHLNIGSAFLDPHRSSGRWWWLRQSYYDSLKDVLTADPDGYWQNVRRNLADSAKNLPASAGIAAPLVPLSVLLGRRAAGRDTWWIVVTSVALFVALISQAFTRDYFFLSPAVLFTVVGSAWLATRWERVEAKGRFRRAPGWLLVAPMLLSGAGLTAMETRAYFQNYSRPPTVDAIAAGAALRAQPGIASKRVMAIHPVYAYEAGSRYVMTPLWYPGSILQFVRYEYVRPQVKRYAPRIPVTLPDDGLGADYLVVNKGLVAALPQFQGLLTPDKGYPAGWQIIYRSEWVVVYRIPD